MVNQDIVVEQKIMTKQEIVAEFTQNHLTIDKMVNEQIVTLDQDDYEATIESWADAFFIKQNQRLEADAQAQAKATAKAALLQRLGITEDEARLLLA